MSEAAAGLTAAQVPKLTLKWAYGFSDDVTALGAMVVVNGTLFEGSASGVVQALDIADRAGMEALFARHRFDRVVHLAAQAGVRYARHSEPMRAMILRNLTFSVCASALWALMPLVARTVAEQTLIPLGVPAMAAVFALILRRAAADLNTVPFWQSTAQPIK